MAAIRFDFEGSSFQIVNPCLHITQLHIYCPDHPHWEAMEYRSSHHLYRCTATKPVLCIKYVPMRAVLAELEHWQYRLEGKR